MPDDHAAWIIISAALGLSMILLFAAIRAFIRAYISSEYGIDDYLVSVATVRIVICTQNAAADDRWRHRFWGDCMERSYSKLARSD